MHCFLLVSGGVGYNSRVKYITTPIYYVNAEPHIGHAVTTLAADMLARFWRLNGQSTYFLAGTDEHGAKIAETARKAGKTPQALSDEVSSQFQVAWQALNIQYDGFIRTTDPNHEKFVQQFLQDLYAKGHIYKGEYKGLYCLGCEEFKAATQLVGGTCPVHPNHNLKKVAEETYLFKLTAYRQQLTALIERNEFRISPPERKNEVLRFIGQGLKDVAMSRKNVAWGIPLPWDKEHTVYVWVDALLNYLSAAGGSVFEKRPSWPPTLQLIGKDILRFHAVIWPALLLAAGKEQPREIFAHGYFTVDGQKMSKSLGNVITPRQLIDRYGLDGARYLLIKHFSANDGDITFERLDNVYTSELANNWGNLVSRVGKIVQNADLTYHHGNLELKMDEMQQKYKEKFNALDPSGALDVLQGRVSELNGYIEQEKPWTQADPHRLGEVVTCLVENVLALAVLFSPALPTTSARVLADFGSSLDQIDCATLGGVSHATGKIVKPIAPLFPRLLKKSPVSGGQ